MKVQQIASNMTEITTGDKTILVSYSTPVACHITGEGYYSTDQKWSSTTSRHISKWLHLHGAHECDKRPQSFFDKLI